MGEQVLCQLHSEVYGLTIMLKPEGWDQPARKAQREVVEAEGTVGANDPRQEGDGRVEEQQGGW